MGERAVRDREAAGSSPVIPTNRKPVEVLGAGPIVTDMGGRVCCDGLAHIQSFRGGSGLGM